MPKNETNPAPHAALVAALSELSNVAGTKINPQFRTKYVTLDALLDSVRPILAAHDLALSQPLVSEADSVGVETNVIHTSGHVFAFGVIRFKTSGLTPQQISSAVTYGRRVGLSSALGVSIDLDDDGKAASAIPAFPKNKHAGKWYDFVPEDQLERAYSYLLKKNWLRGDQNLMQLDEAHKNMILENKAAFLAAISRAQSE